MTQPQNARRARSAALGMGPRTARGIQIGPKIRVGGTLGKIGQNVKTTVGKIASNPIVDAGLSFIPGVGPLAAAGISAAGRALDTTHGSVGVGDVAESGLSGYAAGKAGDTVDSFLSNLLSKNSTPGGGIDWMNAAKGIFSGGGSDGQGHLGSIGDMLGKLPGAIGGIGKAGSGLGGSSLIDDLLLGGTIASGAADKQRAQGFQDKAASYATGDYDKNAPLRDQARTMVQDRSTPDLSNIFANSENPYDRARRGAPQLGARVPVASTY